ncbi:MAG: hypothetical protein U5K31_11920 [Balneolaceae bacterium]|nr:hypothetical protein [Balneolaceae bacterium]
MKNAYFYHFLSWCAAGALLPLAAWLMLGPEALLPAAVAYLLSFLFTGSNFAVILKIGVDSDRRFYRIFLVSIALRFLLVLGAIYLALAVVKFHHIYFTVSFIISYLFHSVIEIIFLNKTLETEAEF